MSQISILSQAACCVLGALLAAGCGARNQEKPIGEGFVAPATLNLRQELGPRQPSVATVRHGERVEILARRRRFVKVRTAGGVVGWTDSQLLFGPEQMEALGALGRYAARLPSQGEATVLDTLNVHAAPSRQAPSFRQIHEGQHVAVVAHKAVREGARADDWSLVRLPEGSAGWVLTRMLVMALPDEVAQYAEGHIIMSYFPLGEVRDGDQVKSTWLWTTMSRRAEDYDFDSVRVFVWNTRRHRYETAHIERNLKGFYPVRVEGAGNGPAGFSFVAEEKDESRSLRRYAFQGFRVRLVSREPAPAALQPPTVPASGDRAPERTPAEKTFFEKLEEQFTRFRSHLLKK